jgi:hypothetical protein
VDQLGFLQQQEADILTFEATNPVSVHTIR